MTCFESKAFNIANNIFETNQEIHNEVDTFRYRKKIYGSELIYNISSCRA